jgi:multiple sugar transport system ATP-binding protein
VATVTFTKASRSYPGSTHPAVDELDLQITDGEFLVLVGPSGCGKSTTLRMLTGLEPVVTGYVHIGDTAVTCCRRNATSPWSSRATRCTRT